MWRAAYLLCSLSLEAFLLFLCQGFSQRVSQNGVDQRRCCSAQGIALSSEHCRLHANQRQHSMRGQQLVHELQRP